MLSGYQFIFGGIVMVILGLIMGGRITHVSVNAMLMLFYLACISAVAYSIWGILLKYNPVSKVATFWIYKSSIWCIVISMVAP